MALAAVYGGKSRMETAEIGGMDRQTLRDWAHRFNQEGPDGLADMKRSVVERFAAEISEGSLSRLLKELSFSHISGRRQHAKQDMAVIEAFKKLPADACRPCRPFTHGHASASREYLAISSPKLARKPRLRHL